MVGFSDLSDTDDSAINEIISQAQDAVVLDQISTINCSGFTDSVLPSHLESRFRKLKSFPTTKSPEAKAHNFSTLSSRNFHHTVNGNPQSPNLSPPKQNPHSKQLNQKPKHDSVSISVSGSSPPFGSASASASSPSSQESSMSSLFKPTQKHEQNPSNQKSVSSKSLRGSPSPPRKTGCLWCSPKKKKKSKENLDASDELLSELGIGSFSMKQQQKMLKKAMKEEEKIRSEAEKIVQWAKHASARMNLSDIEDEFSD